MRRDQHAAGLVTEAVFGFHHRKDGADPDDKHALYKIEEKQVANHKTVDAAQTALKGGAVAPHEKYHLSK